MTLAGLWGKVGASWGRVVPKLGQVGAELGQSWGKLGQSWGKVGASSWVVLVYCLWSTTNPISGILSWRGEEEGLGMTLGGLWGDFGRALGQSWGKLGLGFRV